MLRSLVGSEMCIRDRYRRGDRLDHQFLCGIFPRNHSVRNGSIPLCPNRCLLYTSDAADDLLCVDLGGRRIIKKKKTQKTIEKLIDKTKNNQKFNNALNPQHHITQNTV